MFLDFNASAPGTTTVTITEKSGPKRQLLNKGAGATDVYLPLFVEQLDITGASYATKQYGPAYLVGSPLTIAVAASNALTPALTAYLVTEDSR